MKVAINEAKKSHDSDNYFIGAVIVKDGLIISTGYSDEKNNKIHAEEFAIKNCKESLKGSEIYVTMEPCDWRNSGRKSCCDLIINSGIGKVVYGVLDPREECNGIEKLISSGIEVVHFKSFEDDCKQITPSLFIIINPEQQFLKTLELFGFYGGD